jgi:RNA polymerase sigma-70 factor (ECF subfamily)
MDKEQQNYQPMRDAELVNLAQRGNDGAFAELFGRYRTSSLKLALSILRNHEDAEDDVQTAFWKAYTNLDRFQQDAQFTTWLNRIVINQCLMRLRSAKRRRTFSIDEATIGDRVGTLELRDARQSPEAALGQSQVEHRLRAEVERIPPILRQVLQRDLERKSAQEIATELGITVSAVKSRLLRARRELRVRMERHTGMLGLATLVADNA